MTRVIVDAFGGDNAPLEIIKGARQAVDELGITVILTGDEEKIKQAARSENISLAGIELAHAPNVIPVDEEPTKLLRQYRNSSMAVGFTLLADSGANTECRPEMLRQFAVMGSIYMNKVHGIKNPRVGLVNIGTEDTKGGDLQIETNRLLKTAGLNYVGNMEARELPLGGCDVAICDGFTGNIILKLTEGMGKMMKNELKDLFLASFVTKLGAVLVSGQMKSFKNKFDYKEHGGAMLLGVRKPVIKAHGSSDGLAMKNAIRQAKLCHESGIIPTIEQALAAMGDATANTEE